MIAGSLLHRLGLAGVLLAASLMPALAQGAPAPGTLCGLFPLACPGTAPPLPPPLVGPPDEEMAPPPPPAHAMAKHKRAPHKRKPKPAAQ